MTVERTELLARMTFARRVADRWPAQGFIVEARLESEPWSLRVRPWGVPDETGTCMAYVEFLISEAPWTAGTPIPLTVGPHDIGFCIIPQVESVPKSDLIERDFLDLERGGPVRSKAAQPCI